jgi:HK97 gp10 family phage protein
MIKMQVKWQNSIPDLRKIGAELTRDVIAAPMEKVATLLRDRMKDYCPVGKSGNLQKSISYKVVIHEGKNLTVAIVGPRRGARGRPTHYAHLVEFGHIMVVPGINAKGKSSKRVGEYVAAHPFMRPAVETIRDTINEVLGEEIGNLLSFKCRASMGGKKVTVSI